jgi:hypothetical protein
MDQFQSAIKEYLDKRASEDPLFAKTYAKENKSIEKCCNFILHEVKDAGRNGFSDEEVYGLAVHYYDEDNIPENKTLPLNAKVVINKSISKEESKPITKEDIEKMKERCTRPKEEDDLFPDDNEENSKKHTKTKSEQPEWTGTLF